MTKHTLPNQESRIVNECQIELDKIVRIGAQRMLQSALEVEVADYIEPNKSLIDSEGRRAVTRNGRMHFGNWIFSERRSW